MATRIYVIVKAVSRPAGLVYETDKGVVIYAVFGEDGVKSKTTVLVTVSIFAGAFHMALRGGG